MNPPNPPPANASIVVCALYHFTDLPDYERWQQPLLTLMTTEGLRGTLLLAAEGINGTVAGSRAGIDALLSLLQQDTRFAGLSYKESFDREMPFYRRKVKLKQEIVTMGVTNLDPRNIRGTYVKPRDWNALISDPEVTVIDTRNEYEIMIGTFDHAINPHTTTFREFPAYAEQHLDKTVHKKIAMFCTGGIRCEKSTAYLKAQGFEEVYHLEGGILKYLETVPEEDSLWRGECFVFDNRVTVDHNLEKGQYDQCHACRMPIDALARQSNAYVKGISCPHCIGNTSADQQQRFVERQRQIQLAHARGESHIGEDAIADMAENKTEKIARKTQERNKNQNKNQNRHRP